MSMLAKQLPKVSREFALDLVRQFPPKRITPEMSAETILKVSMQNYGEQRVLEKVLQASSNKIVSSKVEDIKPEVIKENTDNSTLQEKLDNAPVGTYVEVSSKEMEELTGKTRLSSWFKGFTTRTSN